MPFVAEDGTGIADANSFVSVPVANAYFSLRGNAAWAALTDSAKEILLIRATDYINEQYNSRWIGEPKSGTQGLAWPRRVSLPYAFGEFTAVGGGSGWGFLNGQENIGFGYGGGYGSWDGSMGGYAVASEPVPDGVPDNLIKAVCELALVANSGDLYAPGNPAPAGNAIMVSRTKTVGPLTKTEVFRSDPGSTRAVLNPQSDRISALLAPLLDQSGGKFSSVRA